MLSTDAGPRITSTHRRGPIVHDRPATGRTRDRDRLGPRMRVGLHQRRLDRELADGLPAWGSPERELRAGQLLERRSRSMLARSLRRVVADAQSRRRSLSPLVAPACGAMLPCEAAMLTLAERIDGDGPVRAAGLARTRLLLTDGYGPLHNRAARTSLEAELLAIDEALRSR